MDVIERLVRLARWPSSGFNTGGPSIAVNGGAVDAAVTVMIDDTLAESFELSIPACSLSDGSEPSITSDTHTSHDSTVPIAVMTLAADDASRRALQLMQSRRVLVLSSRPVERLRSELAFLLEGPTWELAATTAEQTRDVIVMCTEAPVDVDVEVELSRCDESSSNSSGRGGGCNENDRGWAHTSTFDQYPNANPNPTASSFGATVTTSSYTVAERELKRVIGVGSIRLFYLPWHATQVAQSTHGICDSGTSTSGQKMSVDPSEGHTRDQIHLGQGQGQGQGQGECQVVALEVSLLGGEETRAAFPLTLHRMPAPGTDAPATAAPLSDAPPPLTSVYELQPDHVPQNERAALKRLSRHLAGLVTHTLQLDVRGQVFTMGSTSGLLGGTLCQDVEEAMSAQRDVSGRVRDNDYDYDFDDNDADDADAGAGADVASGREVSQRTGSGRRSCDTTKARLRSGIRLLAALRKNSQAQQQHTKTGTLVMLDRTLDLVSPISHPRDSSLVHRVLSCLPRSQGCTGERMLEVDCKSKRARELAMVFHGEAAPTPTPAPAPAPATLTPTATSTITTSAVGARADSYKDDMLKCLQPSKDLYPALVSLGPPSISPSLLACRRCHYSTGLYRSAWLAPESSMLVALWARLEASKKSLIPRGSPHTSAVAVAYGEVTQTSDKDKEKEKGKKKKKSKGAGATTFSVIQDVLRSIPKRDLCTRGGILGLGLAAMESLQRSAQAQVLKVQASVSTSTGGSSGATASANANASGSWAAYDRRQEREHELDRLLASDGGNGAVVYDQEGLVAMAGLNYIARLVPRTVCTENDKEKVREKEVEVGDISHLLLLTLRVFCFLAAVYANDADGSAAGEGGGGGSDFAALGRRAARERHLGSALDLLGTTLEEYLCGSGAVAAFERAKLGLGLGLGLEGDMGDVGGGGGLEVIDEADRGGVSGNDNADDDDWDDWGDDDGVAGVHSKSSTSNSNSPHFLRNEVRAVLMRAIGVVRESGSLSAPGVMTDICLAGDASRGTQGGLLAQLAFVLAQGYPLGSSPVAHQQSTLHPLRREQQLLLSALRPAHGNAFAELASVVGSGLGLLAQGLAGGFGSFLAASAPDPIAEERQQNSGKGEGNVSTDGDVATVVVFILGGITAHEDVEVDMLLAFSEYRADIGQGLDKLQMGEQAIEYDGTIQQGFAPLSVQRAPSDDDEDEYEPRGKSSKSGKRDHSPRYSPYSKGRRVTRNDDPLETDIDVGEDDEEG